MLPHEQYQCDEVSFDVNQPERLVNLCTNVKFCSLIGDPIGHVEIGDSEKPRSVAVHAMRRLVFWTDVGSKQAIFRARIDGAERMTLAEKLDGVSAMTIDAQQDLVFFAHGKVIDMMRIDGQNK